VYLRYAAGVIKGEIENKTETEMNKRIRVGLIIAAGVFIIAELTFIVYNDLTWSKNLSPFLGIIAMICVITSMILQIREDKKQKAKLTDNRI